MKKFALFLFFSFLFSVLLPINVYAADVEINKKNFPDEGFRTYVKNNFDKNNDNVLNDSEAEVVTVLPVDFTYDIASDDYGRISITQSNSSFPDEIADFTGIQYFPKLEIFSCQNNNLDNDPKLGKNLELKALLCNNSNIQSLELTSNDKLLYLDCSNNQIEELNLTKNTKLLYLDCSNNQITDIEFYEAGEKKITVTRLSGDVPVSVDVLVSEDPNPLMYLKCDYNEMNFLSLIELDEGLLWLKCDHNKLAKKFLADDAENLLWLECDHNQIISLDIENNKKIRYLKCDHNLITEIDAGNSPKLEHIICDNNRINELLLPLDAGKLVYLSCSSNDLDIMESIPSGLEYINFSGNKIEDTQFLSKGTSLKTINCAYNKLEEIDLSKFTLLEIFICDNNAFRNLSFANNPSLKTFSGASQKIYGEKVTNSKNKTYPYEFDLADLISNKGNTSRISDISVLNANNSSIKHKIEDSTNILLTEKPASIKYKYNPKGNPENNYLDVTVFFSAAPKDDKYGANDDTDNSSGNNDDSSVINNIGGNFYSVGGNNSGGGCNFGFGSGFIALVLISILKKKK